MTRKGRLSRSKKELLVSARDKHASSALPPGGKSEPLAVPPKQARVLTGEPASRQTQTTFASQAHEAEREDLSVPPVDVDTHFFDSAHAVWEPATYFEVRDPRVAIKSSPTAARRRAHLAKYVKVAVTLSFALCLAAVVKAAATSSHQAPLPSAALAELARSVEAEPALLPPAAAPPGAGPAAAVGRMVPAVTPSSTTEVLGHAVAAAPIEKAQAPSSAAPDPGAVTGLAPPLGPATGAAPAVSAPGTPASIVAGSGAASGSELAPPDPKAAARAKTVATNALERGNVAAAVEAGERSVALDPTDGEAWLILGAAYQQKGDMRGAVRSFKACLQQGKRGPKSECAAMLR